MLKEIMEDIYVKLFAGVVTGAVFYDYFAECEIGV